MKLSVLHSFLALALLALFAAFTTACSDSDDDDGSVNTSDIIPDQAETAADGDPASLVGDSGTAEINPNERPGLVLIKVECDSAQSTILTFINGDDINPPVAQSGGDYFANTVLGSVTFGAEAEGVTFEPVTIMVRESIGEAFQTVTLRCQ